MAYKNNIIDNNVEYIDDIMFNNSKPKINDIKLYNEALYYLKTALKNNNANFRDGQYEAIEAVFTNKRSLVVQKPVGENL